MRLPDIRINIDGCEAIAAILLQEKARADAAEARVAELDAENSTLRLTYESAKTHIGLLEAALSAGK
jgi:hypothetical protein